MRGQAGQASILTIFFMVVLVGCVAAVLDVGAWYRADRKLQANTDAAALAAAQALPEDTGASLGLAVEYGDKNGGDVDAADVSFTTAVMPNDTVVVETEHEAPGVFTQLFGYAGVEVHARAAARAGGITEARYAAPIAVDIKHPLLQCKPLPCFDEDTELDLTKTGPGAFRLVNIDGSRGGTGPATLADWIRNGYDGYMPLDWYFSDPGAKFNSSHIKAAMNERIGDELLFPVYDFVKRGGANFEYHVVGWVGFLVTDFEAKGSGGKVYGQFTRVLWEGIMGQTAPDNDFGVRKIALVE